MANSWNPAIKYSLIALIAWFVVLPVGVTILVLTFTNSAEVEQTAALHGSWKSNQDEGGKKTTRRLWFDKEDRGYALHRADEEGEFRAWGNWEVMHADSKDKSHITVRFKTNTGLLGSGKEVTYTQTFLLEGDKLTLERHDGAPVPSPVVYIRSKEP